KNASESIATPVNFAYWLDSRVRPTPVMYPTRTGLGRTVATNPSRTTAARRQSPPTISASAAINAVYRLGAPAAIAPTPVAARIAVPGSGPTPRWRDDPTKA